MKRMNQDRRAGNILVLSVVGIVVIFAMLAFAVDLGYLYNTRTELQRTADAAALAGAWKLLDHVSDSQTRDMSYVAPAVESAARDYAAQNPVGTVPAELADEDMTIGYITDFSNPNSPIDTSDPQSANAVRVRVRRTSSQNGAVPLFFARVLGHTESELEAEATAGVRTNFRGFKPGDWNLPILPITLDLGTWESRNGPLVSDEWAWNNELGEVVPGSDGLDEINLYPQDTGAPGNRGTVNIGDHNNNSTQTLGEQIRNGISSEDLSGALEFGDNGTLTLNGDPGISNGIKDDLAAVIGEGKVIPIFESVSGNGNNANYQIVKLVGVRIMEVKLTGNNKRLMIQPAHVILRGGIPAGEGEEDLTENLYSPVSLIR